jgi:hypothetical protein
MSAAIFAARAASSVEKVKVFGIRVLPSEVATVNKLSEHRF